MTDKNTDESGTEYDGFANYESVSNRIEETIYASIEAYARLGQADPSQYKIGREEERHLRAEILTAALIMEIEIEEHASAGEEWAEDILGRWSGENGYIDRLRQAPSGEAARDWCRQFVTDIRRAGVRLGYLKAGREVEQEDELADADPYDSDIYDMIKQM
jgi:hypothetical protein